MNVFVSDAFLSHCQRSESLPCIAGKAYVSTDPLGRVTMPCCVINEPVYLEGGTVGQVFMGKEADRVREVPACRECILRCRDAIYSEASVPLLDSFGQVLDFCRMYDKAGALMEKAKGRATF